MKTMQKNILALTVLATTSLPALAESVDLRVTGVISPVACKPKLLGAGTIDYGVIKTDTVSATDYTQLDEKTLDFSINCEAPVKMAIVASDRRFNTSVGEQRPYAAVNPTNTATALYGLGLDGAAKIGGYSLTIKPDSILADNVKVSPIQRDANYPNWDTRGAGGLQNWYAPREISFAKPGTDVPISFTNLTAKLAVKALINKGSELNLTKPVTLNGLATIELVYL